MALPRHALCALQVKAEQARMEREVHQAMAAQERQHGRILRSASSVRLGIDASRADEQDSEGGLAETLKVRSSSQSMLSLHARSLQMRERGLELKWLSGMCRLLEEGHQRHVRGPGLTVHIHWMWPLSCRTQWALEDSCRWKLKEGLPWQLSLASAALIRCVCCRRPLLGARAPRQSTCASTSITCNATSPGLAHTRPSRCCWACCSGCCKASALPPLLKPCLPGKSVVICQSGGTSAA